MQRQPLKHDLQVMQARLRRRSVGVVVGHRMAASAKQSPHISVQIRNATFRLQKSTDPNNTQTLKKSKDPTLSVPLGQ